MQLTPRLRRVLTALADAPDGLDSNQLRTAGLIATSSPVGAAVRPLVQAGLVAVQRDPAPHPARYTVTQAGRAALGRAVPGLRGRLVLTRHGRCGQSWWQRGNATSHCAACHLTFTALDAFDMHRTGGRCADPATDPRFRPFPAGKHGETTQLYYARRDAVEHARRRFTPGTPSEAGGGAAGVIAPPGAPEAAESLPRHQPAPLAGGGVPC